MSDILVVASKIKAYIREKSNGLNTSAGAMPVLTDIVKKACDKAIENAQRAGRKTVLERDFSTETE